jgi:hypothetical protein
MPQWEPGETEENVPVRRTGSGLRPLSAIVPAISRKAIGAKAMRLAALLDHWPDVVGKDFAQHTAPLKIIPGRDGHDGSLHLAISASFAPVWQHAEPQLLARINNYLGGEPRIGRVVLKQQSRPTPPRPQRRQIGAAERQRIADDVASISSPELRHALERLGLALLARQSGETGKKE